MTTTLQKRPAASGGNHGGRDAEVHVMRKEKGWRMLKGSIVSARFRTGDLSRVRRT